MAPIIGITTYGRTERQLTTAYYDEYYVLPAAYVDAVRARGRRPRVAASWRAAVGGVAARVDGIIVAGGSDIRPSEYGGNPAHPNLTIHDAQRDETELALTRELLAEGTTPTLYICRGMQVLNVAAGGSLHEHIPDIHPEDIHRGPDGGWTVQPVGVEPTSFLHEVMGTESAATYSGHHQAVKEIGAGLKAVSSAPDGIIEALEKPGHPWLVAVQWHPEVSAAADASQQRLFDGLVQAAAQREK